MNTDKGSLTKLTPKVIAVRALGAGGVIIGLALILPLIYYALLSTLGLLAIGVVALVGFALVKTIPLMGQRLENKLLGLRKAEARANPIEQIENNVVRKAEQLNAFKKGLENIGAQLASLVRSLSEQKRKDPTEDFSEQESALSAMKVYYDTKKASYAQALQALEDYKKAVERARFKHGFGTAAAGIAQAMNSTDAESLVQSMLSDEAFRAVDLKFNSAFAALDVESIEVGLRSSVQQLNSEPTLTLEQSQHDGVFIVNNHERIKQSR